MLRSKPNIYASEDSCDLSHATYDPQLSKVEFDAEKNTFVIGQDKVLFRTPFEVISALLESQSFVVNFENLVACLDALRFAVIAEAKTGKDGPATVKKFMPCMTMGLPQKSQQGPMLRMFYDEISRYEAALAIHEGKVQDDKKGQDKQDETKRQVEALSVENATLKKRLRELTQEVQLLQSLERSMRQSLSDEARLPMHAKKYLVKTIHAETRTIELRDGRQQLVTPCYAALSPLVAGEECLGVNGSPTHLQISSLNPQPKKFLWRRATVMGFDGKVLRLKIGRMTEMAVKASDGQEAQQFRKLRARQEVLLASYGNIVYQVCEVQAKVELDLVASVHEAIALQQLRQTYRKVE